MTDERKQLDEQKSTKIGLDKLSDTVYGETDAYSDEVRPGNRVEGISPVKKMDRSQEKFIWRKREVNKNDIVFEGKLSVSPEQLLERIQGFFKSFPKTYIHTDDDLRFPLKEEDKEKVYIWTDFKVVESKEDLLGLYDHKFTVIARNTIGRPREPVRIIDILTDSVHRGIIEIYYMFSQEALALKLAGFLTKYSKVTPLTKLSFQTAERSKYHTDVPGGQIGAVGDNVTIQGGIHFHGGPPLSQPPSGGPGGSEDGSYDLRKVQTLLNDIFSEDDLRDFCLYEADFRPVYDDFKESDRKTDILRRLISYARQKGLIAKLLDWARQTNPARHERDVPYTM